MAVDVAAPAAERSLSAPSARIAAVPARVVLAGIVGISFVARLAAALAHATPLYFPDEYIYASLARSLAESGRPLIRGTSASFPALLEPLLAAPFWLAGDPMLAYRLTQGLNALAMSLAAVPVYLLCRRLALGNEVALAAAAVAVASPNLLYASFVLADPIAYPLVLGALCAGVYALDRPTRRSQLAFVALSGLATFARVQYVILPVAFVVAAVVVERRRVLRRHALPLA
ncbi:MAG: glycosyltransferase family 39 protein, partial [Actinomycetota bacterium]|nr:glycosyltransferase family 39 protein [Actinomycetota bacterium]